MTAWTRYLPDAKNRLLANVVAVLAAFYGLITLALVIGAARGSTPLASLVTAALFALFSWGLWRLKKWARSITVFILWFFVVVTPFAVLQPYTTMEWQGGAPRWEFLVPGIGAGMALGLFLLHVLGRHKAEFSW